ncbi:tetratricopeptide repeat protein [Bosea sp. R86505]|uniref:CHAT domain-containing tetratricopeptide repeat protein n=1 Tax=Bosea sp. R86505 TaxID=3101710 RepID=UPI00366D3D78
MSRARSSIGFDRLLANLAAMAAAAILAIAAPNRATAQMATPPAAKQATPQAGPAAADQPLTAEGINTLNEETESLYVAGNFAGAESVARRVLAKAEQLLGADHIDVATSLNNLAVVLRSLNQLSEAEELHRRALAIREKALPEGHPHIATSLFNFAGVLASQNRLNEAEVMHRRALAIRERALPEGHSYISISIDGLAQVLTLQNRLSEAETLHRRALAINERALPEGHRNIATSLNNLAFVLATQNRLVEAEALFRRTLAILENALPEGHPDIAVSVGNVAFVLASQNRVSEAASLYRRGLAIVEKALPEGHPTIATSLNNLGEVLVSQSHLGEAEALHRRALAIREKALPQGHPDIAASLNNLAAVLSSQNRLSEAESLHRRALAIRERALSESHPDIAISLNNLGQVLALQKRLGEAGAVHRRARAILEKALPEDHPSIAVSLNNLAEILSSQNRFGEAEALHRLALAILEKARPKSHLMIATSLENLGVSLTKLARNTEAQVFLSASAAIRTAPPNMAVVAGGGWRWYAKQRLGIGTTIEQRDGFAAAVPISDARRSAFRDLQWERLGGTGGAIAAASARSQAADPEVGRLARERDRLLGELKRSDDRFIAVSSSTTLAQDERGRQMAELRTESESLRRALEVADAEIGQRFPAYAELAEGRPLPVEELQPLLGPDEVLVSITPYDGGGFVFAYGREDGRVATLPQVGDVAALAARLRCSAALPDRTCAPGGPTAQPAPATAVAMAAGAAPGASAPAGAGAVRGPEEEALGRPDLAAGGAPFDLALAHDLYTRLFPEEIRAFVKGKRLILAPAPELLALPWHLLLTAPPPEGWDAPGTDRVALYKQAPWLFQSHPAITVLPTIASLRALRGNAVVRAPADRAFIGLGDPVIGRTRAERDAAPLDCAPAAAAAGPVQVAALRAPGSTENVFGDARGEDGFVLASVEAVRGQPRLPDSRCELIQIADTIAARQAQAEPGRDTAFPAVPRPARAGVDILLGPDASETRLKALNTSGELARYRILHFATHGLVSGELQLPEPALVLSPPAKASVQDDGLLTASEIATLTLAADWVVLSACNTAAGDAKGAEAFTGLAKAFFYAGAKSLLTSSWPVYSDAAVAITTLAFQNQHDGRAKALNHAMRDTLAAANSEHTAHPAYWAPFAIVGDGR